jgi:hypothetical protein
VLDLVMEGTAAHAGAGTTKSEGDVA